MNELDFTYRVGSPVYIPRQDLFHHDNELTFRRYWTLGVVQSSPGIKSHPEDDFMYLVRLQGGSEQWNNLSEMKDARTFYQPEDEILQRKSA